MYARNPFPASCGEDSPTIPFERWKVQPAHEPRTRVGALLNPNPLRTLRIVSLVLVGVWCVWWAVSLYHGELVGVRRSWFGCAAGLQRRFSHGLRLSYPDLAGRPRSVRR